MGFEEAELRALDAFRQLRQIGVNPTCGWSSWASAVDMTGKIHRSSVNRGIGDPTPRLSRRAMRRPAAGTGKHRLSSSGASCNGKAFQNRSMCSRSRGCELQGRSVRWIEFRRERLFGGGSRGQGLGYGFAIEFPEPVSGPICLGYACHFGLGLFLPVMT